MATPITLGPRDFFSKSAAKTYIGSEILHRYGVGVPIDNQEHIEVLMDVLFLKDNADEKIGGGINYFYVEHTSKFRDYVSPDALTLVIRHIDPNERDVDFGYTATIDGADSAAKVKDALRHEAEPLRDRFKFGHFASGEVVHDIEGEPMTEHDQAEVRYGSPTWGEMTFAFAHVHGGWDAIETTSGDGDAQIGRRLVDDGLRTSWLEYWTDNADPILKKKSKA